MPTERISIPANNFPDATRENATFSTFIDQTLRYRGRAADKLATGLPVRPVNTFTRCPLNDLANPKRIYLDPYGNIQICQGVNIGNAWEMPLSRVIADYNVDTHPILGLLSQGGPALLASHYRAEQTGGFIDACHLCYTIRRELVKKLPEYLAPAQVYGF